MTNSLTILPGLTSTIKERIPEFVDDLRKSDVRQIALFPTVLTAEERSRLYQDLESIAGLTIPHVHLRTDFDEAEIIYVADRFGTEVFNIHPAASRHPFPHVPRQFAGSVFVENVEETVSPEDLVDRGGLCPDFAHLEAARHQGNSEYVTITEEQLRSTPIGCCHIAGIRVGDPNDWSGGWDHHNFKTLADFDYLRRYLWCLPNDWASLELENTLAEQLEAVAYIERMLVTSGGNAPSGSETWCLDPHGAV